MSINLGWGTISDPLFGVAGKKINSVEWTFPLYEKAKANVSLTAWVKEMFALELNRINDPWAAVGCHMSFLTSAAKDRNHDFHVVLEVWNREKIANATSSSSSSSWRDRPDTSNDANFRLVYQYNAKFEYVREGMPSYNGPLRPPGIDQPYTFTRYREAADKLATGAQSATG